MATEKKENVNPAEIKKEEATAEGETVAPIIDVPVDDPESVETSDVKDGENREDLYKDIDAVCEMLSIAKKERDDENEQRRIDEEKKRKREEDNAMAAQKAKDDEAKQAEEVRKISESRYIRKKMKRKATAMLFCLCIMSAVFGYVVAGIMVYLIFDPKVWIFVGVMGIFGMINTLIHTYLYRYIREEIYRK